MEKKLGVGGRVCSRLLGLGVAGALVAGGGRHVVAQAPAEILQAIQARPLTVQPRTMATGTTNPARGVYRLAPAALPRRTGGTDGLRVNSVFGAGEPVPSDEYIQPFQARPLTVQPRAIAAVTPPPATGNAPRWSTVVYVPPKCVGATRCPLLIAMINGLDWLRPMADKYGIILSGYMGTGNYPELFDAMLQMILRRFAIDPAKIAVLGRCAASQAAMTYGLTNPHVFSRILSVSGGAALHHLAGMAPPSPTAEVLIDRGLWGEGAYSFEDAQTLRQRGHRTTVALQVRGHEHQLENYDYLGYWLQQSWAKPDPATRPAPAVVAEPMPALTVEALRQLTTFWTSFFQEPDSIWRLARRDYLHEVALPAGKETAAVWMTDMPAFAARYPSVAAKLRAAGLTAQQHDAYRLALFSAKALLATQRAPRTGRRANVVPAVLGVAESSVLAKNAAFVKAHRDEIEALELAGTTKENVSLLSKIAYSHGDTPATTEYVGPAGGFWRTP